MTGRLVDIAVRRWPDVDGFAAGHNLPPLEEMPLGRFVNFMWWWMTRDASAEDREKLEEQLWMPPPGEVGEGLWSAEAEADSFAALKAGLVGK